MFEKPYRGHCRRRVPTGRLIQILVFLIAWGFSLAPVPAGELPLFRDPKAPVEQRVEDLLGRLTLEEKIRLCHGNVTQDQAELFHAGGVPRLGIGQILMLDGRQGIRPLGDKTQKTTALPCTLSLSCSWDTAAASAFGRVLAEELLAMKQHILLGPCMNLMRSPLGGRNFENLGEDPLLAGAIASAYIDGAQRQGVAGCSAILVANDYETWRHYTSSNLDERTLREIHLLPFEITIRDGRVWTMMTANSLLNGVHTAQNKPLLQGIIKDAIGFDGVMLTDWRAAYDPAPTALAGTDMTTGFCAYVFGDGRLLAAVKAGQVPQALIDEKVRRILRLYVRTGVLNPELRARGALETPEHRELARSLATQGMVLLKNERGILPIDPAKVRTILVTGPGAEAVPFGTGSGAVRPPFEITPLAGLRTALGGHVKLVHVPWGAPGAGAKAGKKAKGRKKAVAMDLESNTPLGKAPSSAGAAPPREKLIDAARGADLVLFFVSGPACGEGRDMANLDLPGGQAEAIDALAAANPNVAAVLMAGGPVSLEPWADRVPAILGAWYAGQSTGDAIADVLTGKVNPGGHLSFTIGKRLEDYACHALGLWPPRLILDKAPGRPGFKPEERKSIRAYDADYKEGIFMGYRWFDEKGIEPRYPFGHGLSYTTFEYDGLKVDRSGDALRVACTVKNTGGREGAEVVQVYVAPPETATPRPPRELKGFAKVTLKPDERRTVEIPLRPSALACYDAATKKWKAEAGKYEILVGSSSRDIRLRESLAVASDKMIEQY